MLSVRPATQRVLGGVLAGVALGAAAAWAMHNKVPGLDGWAVTWVVLFWAALGGGAGLIGRALAVTVRRTGLRRLLATGAGLPAFWLCGDLQYSLLMRHCDANWERAIARDADGVRQGCEAFTRGHGDTALLLIHGFADSPAVYQNMAPALAEKGLTCRAMRLPYFATPMSDYRRTSAAAWRQAVGEELAALRQTHRRVVVVAHSLGGAVAVDYLADHPEAADGVVLLAPLLEVSDRRSPLLPPQTWYRLLDHLVLFTDRVAVPFPPDLSDAEARAALKTDRFIPRGLYRELFDLTARNRQRTAPFPLPVFLVLAGNDEIIDNQAAERFFQQCASPRRLKYVPEAGHVLPLEHGWEGLVEDVAAFVKE
jgi:alpha-beta hydrolase superfamily lysophospholipase